jgi:PTS system mannose-specific IIA component
MVKGVVIGHGNFAKAIVETVEKIVGKQEFVEVVSNIGFSCEDLTKKIKDVLNRDNKDETLIFVDLPGGSCTISCYNLLKDDRDLNIICGVNLPMLLEFFMLREKHTAAELVAILIKKGQENIFKLKSRNE